MGNTINSPRRVLEMKFPTGKVQRRVGFEQKMKKQFSLTRYKVHEETDGAEHAG